MLCLKFKADIESLMKTLHSTAPHFVRCIKPNELKKAFYINPERTHHQLRYLGVLDSIRIRHSGFSYRTNFLDFYMRFVMIASQEDNKTPLIDFANPDPNLDYRQLTMNLMDKLYPLVSTHLKKKNDVGEGEGKHPPKYWFRKSLTSLPKQYLS